MLQKNILGCFFQAIENIEAKVSVVKVVPNTSLSTMYARVIPYNLPISI
jgi:hypothetical protein